ncbi:MAG: bifunctional precorrin-2 dehydrogenase/sirohydrochlorin ferrochelatase [Aquificae bacterium]|nr:bifunctional precorrin-2 dehydrogenase/sirohydrochlorin ferrochelatase [Aquificota bacterium]
MPLFPVFIELTGRPVLVVGGGKVAARKVKQLLPFKPEVTLVSPKATPELRELAKRKVIKWKRRAFRPSDLRGKLLVVLATDDARLQARVSKLCKEKGILCNAVDAPEHCSFIFPSLVRRGELVVGISTSGKVPALSRALREKLEELLPEELGRLVTELERARSSGVRGEELLELARRRLGEVLR